jgi:hypothetical protein
VLKTAFTEKSATKNFRIAKAYRQRIAPTLKVQELLSYRQQFPELRSETPQSLAKQEICCGWSSRSGFTASFVPQVPDSVPALGALSKKRP